MGFTFLYNNVIVLVMENKVIARDKVDNKKITKKPNETIYVLLSAVRWAVIVFMAMCIAAYGFDILTKGNSEISLASAVIYLIILFLAVYYQTRSEANRRSHNG